MANKYFSTQIIGSTYFDGKPNGKVLTLNATIYLDTKECVLEIIEDKDGEPIPLGEIRLSKQEAAELADWIRLK